MKSTNDEKSPGEQSGGNAKYRAPALEKGLDILSLLAGERTPLTLSGICQRLERSQGEIFRMVQVLQARGYTLAEQSPWGAAELIVIPQVNSAPARASSGNDSALGGRLRVGMM